MTVVFVSTRGRTIMVIPQWQDVYLPQIGDEVILPSQTTKTKVKVTTGTIKKRMMHIVGGDEAGLGHLEKAVFIIDVK